MSYPFTNIIMQLILQTRFFSLKLKKNIYLKYITHKIDKKN